MAERLRALLERPLEPALARAVVALALAASTGFAVLVLLGAVGRDAPPPSTPAAARVDRPSSPAVPVGPRSTSGGHAAAKGRGHRVAGQDRQDHPGTEAYRRALRESARHRALQHVPYHRGAVTITLVGARGPRAILSVAAPTVALAHRGYRRFLHRFRDPGVAYLPRFLAPSGSEAPDSRRAR
ncbi:MAG: hypothetical protein J0H06_03205 [Actinobacteria bacterium]|nr:hypothetical protein [Actinomycetota bacterium]OJU84368.1 MAG: hypothetical protein BGO11_16675 [Solirubrobacterales bacterium 70-9]